MDNGSFHKSMGLKWPNNVIPIFQPPNSPELNPIVGEAFPKGMFMGTHQV
jgi:transposase